MSKVMKEETLWGLQALVRAAAKVAERGEEDEKKNVGGREEERKERKEDGDEWPLQTVGKTYRIKDKSRPCSKLQLRTNSLKRTPSIFFHAVPVCGISGEEGCGRTDGEEGEEERGEVEECPVMEAERGLD